MGLKIWDMGLVVLIFVLLQHFAYGATNLDDVAAINSLYAALGSPILRGWTSAAGDPCTDAWQGVQCDGTNIISITLVGVNLGGSLGDNLGSFRSIKSIDFSNNHVGGSIPSSLPASLQTFFLSDNNLTGIIPSTISSLTNLSMLHLQDNQLSGTLDVLQDLPLQDLNIKNNQFSGPIPVKLLNIPTFESDGNLFNTSAAPMPSPPTPSLQPSPPSQGAPMTNQSAPRSGTTSSGKKPGKQSASPSVQPEPNSEKKTQSAKTKRIVGISIASVLGFVILILAILLCMPWCFSRSKKYYQATKKQEARPYIGARENPLNNGSYSQPYKQIEKAQKDINIGIKDEPETEARRITALSKQQKESDLYSKRSTAPLMKLDSALSLSDIEMMVPPPPPPPLQAPPPPPPPPPPFHAERVIVRPIGSAEDVVANSSTRTLPLTFVRSFTIASLQQYTNSFSQENLIGSGMLGTVYWAELPDRKVLAVKKLDKGIASRQKDHDFIELVNNIDGIRHVNIVELVGYCAEHGQRLLIYEYCSNGTLQDALHSDDEYKKKLSWNTRMQMALGAARALEYLHEVCEPPVVHRNFKSANVLLDDELSVCVSDCGLTSLIASGSVSQLSGHLLSAYGYGAPEFESGIYTAQSDVYSFGVVMLELLTGRMSYDRTRVRGEQILVRWAVPQLHDIDSLQRMVDPSLNGEYPTKALSNFADIISRCVQSEPEFRPLMSEVVQDLQRMFQRGSP